MTRNVTIGSPARPFPGIDPALLAAQWTPGKNFDGSLVIGPELVSLDEVDGFDLALETRVNGEVVQSDHTGSMVFDTGTPGGVGVARTPPVFLRPGDVVDVAIDQVGAIRNRVVANGLTSATDRWSRLATAPRS